MFMILWALINTFSFSFVVSIQLPPIWVTSPYVQADSKDVVTKLTTSGSPTAVMTFTRAFSAPPKIAFGIQKYESEDSLTIESFDSYRSAITTTSVKLTTLIETGTGLGLLTLRYIAIDTLFPHSVNCFDSVPIHYGQNSLVNISKSSNKMTIYRNIVNYTAQANALNFAYNNFSLPLSDHKIVLFLTGLSEVGTNDRFGTWIPLKLNYTANILSTSTYQFYATNQNMSTITRIKFSMVVYDSGEIQASGLYAVYDEGFSFSKTGGFVSIPEEFLSNLIVGFKHYTTIRTFTVLHFDIYFKNNTSGVFGIFMPQVVLRPNANSPTRVETFYFHLLYIKTWICPNDTVFNLSNNMCESCPIQNCQVCLTITLCQTCNPGFNLFQAGFKQCSNCQTLNCLSCITNESICTQCDELNNYFLQSNQCILCAIPGCLKCETLLTCQNCDSLSNYFSNPSPTNSTNECILCSIPHCISCQNLTICQVCETGYGKNVSATSILGQCFQCNISNCIACVSFTQCLTCNQSIGFFINTTTLQCQLCTIPNCLQCYNLTQCSSCDITNFYHLNPDSNSIENQCFFCNLTQCINCMNITACQNCNQSNQYFLNLLDLLCHPCTLNQCIQCLNLNQCMVCNQSNQYYLEPLDQLCYPCTLNQCIKCQNFSSCILCNESNQFFLNSSDKLCYPCSLTQCIQCLNLTSCSSCNQSNNYYKNFSDNQCYPCQITQCISCFNISSCLICNSSNNYFLNYSTGLCELKEDGICGDSIFIAPQGCDDGNLINGDGCSSECTIQTNYTCQPNNILIMRNSVCYYIGEITLNISYIEKKDNLNEVEIFLEYGPKDATFWETLDFSSLVSISNMEGFDRFEVIKRQDGKISIIAKYNTDIQGLNLTVILDPSKSGRTELSRVDPVSKSFQMIPNDNQAAIFYDENVYYLAKIVQILAYIVAALSLITFFLGIFGSKIIGIEMMAVIQVSYLSLITLPPLNPCFKSLSKIWFVDGFNYFSGLRQYIQDSYSPINAKGIYLHSQFIKNFNITCLLIFVPLILSLVCLIISKRKREYNPQNSKEWLQKAKKLAAQYTFYGIMFCSYIVFVGFALQIVYGIKNMDQFGAVSIFWCLLFLGIMVLYFVFLIINPSSLNFGEFKTYFKQKQKIKEIIEKTEEIQENCRKQQQLNEEPRIRCHQLWYNLMIVERLIIGICMVLTLNINISPVITIIVFCIISLITLVFRPYEQFRQNIRFLVNLTICIAIQVIYLSYKISSKEIQVKSPIMIGMPILICLLLLVCIIYSVVLMIIKRLNQKKDQDYNQQFSKLYLSTQSKYQLKKNEGQDRTIKNEIMQFPQNFDKNKSESLKKIKKSLNFKNNERQRYNKNLNHDQVLEIEKQYDI